MAQDAEDCLCFRGDVCVPLRGTLHSMLVLALPPSHIERQPCPLGLRTPRSTTVNPRHPTVNLPPAN